MVYGRFSFLFKLFFSFSQTTAAANNISATPTFLFFRNRVRIDQYQGADAAGLEEKIKQHTENDPGNSEDSDIPKGYVSDQLPFEFAIMGYNNGVNLLSLRKLSNYYIAA